MIEKKNRKFDTKVQYLKYKVLREVAKLEWAGTLKENLLDIPKNIVSGIIPTMRCCVYKERAILGERVKMALGGDKSRNNVIQVIDIACDECPASGFFVTDACRGCLSHRCEDVCPKNAISFDKNQKAIIDKDLCVNCGMCAKACPYTAIVGRKRPCENACKVGAITMDKETKYATINDDKCINCGACVYQCPFGAISDTSFMLDVIGMLKQAKEENGKKVYAVIAPSIASQFTYAKLGQVVTSLKVLGFHSVVEAALGADIVSFSEARELSEKGFLTSSCCPAFVSLIEKHYPQMKEFVSHNLSPAAAISKYIKESDPNCKVVFIGPCTAKKMEFQKETVKDYIDSVITFEELQAMIDSKELQIAKFEETPLDNASYYGRIFARCGGLSDSVAEALKEQQIDFDLKGIACDGIDNCKMALFKASKNILTENFIEGMACINGCIGGAGCLTHGPKSKMEIDKYGKTAMEKSIADALAVLK